MTTTPPTRPHAGRGARVAAGASALGLLVGVVGAFLPWFRSGTVERNSFQAVGVVDQFSLLDNGFAVAALRAWLGLPLLAAVVLGLYALRWFRSGALLTLAVSLVAGTIAVLAAVEGGEAAGARGLVGISSTGPVTTATGMGVALLSAFALLGATRRGRRDRGRRDRMTAGVPS